MPSKPPPGRRLVIRPLGIDWDDDASIEAWAEHLWNELATKWGKPVNDPAPVMTDRFTTAVAYATAIHAAQTRKGTAVPYLAHLLGVASLVLEAGGTQDEAIAGLLHDAVEDCGGMPRLADVRVRFGDTVADIVLTCSDSTDEEWKKSVGYWPRKQAYLDHLEASTNPRAVLVSIADKVHNARAIATDLSVHGYEVLTKFNGTAEEILRYYRECLRIGRLHGVPDALVVPLQAAIDTIALHVEAHS